MKKNIYIFLAILVAALLAAGCSGGQQADGSPSGSASAPAENSAAVKPTDNAPAQNLIEPEQLISKADAAEIIGDVQDGEKKEQPAVGQKLIVYKTEGGEDFLQISLTQQAFMSVQGNTPESIYNTTKDAVADASVTDSVDGIGDEYFFGTPGLHILYKGYYIIIACGNTDDEQAREVLKQAAGVAIANLDALLA